MELPLPRDSIIPIIAVSAVGDYNMEQQEQRIISSNRCGYDPNVVELFTPPPEDQGPRPLYIQEAVRRMGKVFDNPRHSPGDLLYQEPGQEKSRQTKEKTR